MFPAVRQVSKNLKAHKRSLFIEQLEGRSLLSGFSVLNLNDGGAGSLRQAILDANDIQGADVISFNVAGTIQLTAGALPRVTDQVDIDGTTAPGFAGAPVVEVDYRGFAGLGLLSEGSGSAIRSLALVHSSYNGITIIDADNVLIVGNFIGLHSNGLTSAANRGNGVSLSGSSGSIIGGSSVEHRNVISANGNNGIRLSDSSSNQIMGNYIGTDATGTLDRGNINNGIVLSTGAMSNIIGGTRGNVISGNNANGVLINSQAKLNTVGGNVIGTTAGGTAALGNSNNGVTIENAGHNLIGQSDPVSSVSYNNADNVSMPVSGWQGIRGADAPGEYLIAGTSGTSGLLFEGTIEGVGTSYAVNYPGSFNTSVYGPDRLTAGNIRLVGSYKNPDYATAPVTVSGFLYEGATAEFATAGNYRTIDYPGAKYNYVHSTMGGLAVGNYDSPTEIGTSDLPLGPGHAYLYDIAQDTFLADVVFPGSLSNTAYGIWQNGKTSYTICGGYSLDPANNLENQDQPIGQAYLVDYDSATGVFSNWASFSYPHGTNFVTHFEGISSVEKGIYTLNADSAQSGSSNPAQGSWVTVHRQADGSFGKATWVDLNYPYVDPTSNVTSSNAVYGNQVVGIVIGNEGPISFQATVNVEFMLSNVISGNGDNGIRLYGAHDNQIAMNFIGTDVSGTLDLGNASSGIFLTAGAARNLIGGVATGGNDPTNDSFVRPPQGNLISGNDANGVYITGYATKNQLSGNFIGTTASGNAALGNTGDGVRIGSANNNSLLGCTLRQDPFVFYNVIGGNGANGLRITNSNDTTIQANFFGVGADNDTAVGNAASGVVVEGSSTRTTMGGPIPLGNVVAANGQNGIVVQGLASYFTSYNTFCGLAAFSDNPYLGNGQDGMLITSTGGNILLRTNVVARNGDDGIEISGSATGVRVAGNIIGLNTVGFVPMGNADNGVEVGGNAHHLVVGGLQPTFNIIPRNIVSANGNNGVAIVGYAHHITVSHAFIGIDYTGERARGNANAGVLLGPGTYSNRIGSVDPALLTVVSSNRGNGIEMSGTRLNTVVGTLIGTNATGSTPMGNAANGILISNSYQNLVGRVPADASPTSGSAANLIAFNGNNGVFIESGIRNAIFANSIYSNDLLGIDLAPGANIGQAAPVLTSAHRRPLGIQVSGSLASKPSTIFILEFFANFASDASGRISLGTKTVRSDTAGVAAFTFFGPLPPANANSIMATATDPYGNTSEFSAVAP